MKRFYFSTALAVTAMLALAGNALTREDIRARMKADLSGYQEAPPISTKGSGDFKAQLNEARDGIEFELNYEDLGVAPLAAHIQFGQPGVNGGILATLCGVSPKPACPAIGPLTGTLVAADIQAIVDQGIALHDFDAALRAIRSGNTYVNVLSATFIKGEIRGQIRGRHFGQFKEDDDE